MRNRRPIGVLAASSSALLIAGWLAVAPVAGAEGDTSTSTSSAVSDSASDSTAGTLSGTISSHNTDGYADDCEDGAAWHWVITGIDPAPDAADVPATITVTWSDGSTSIVPLWKVTGSVAHYSIAIHTDDGVYPTGATADWPAGTDATSYNNFNLSSGPCAEEGEGESTTTTEAPTTTVMDTTTTEAPTTTIEDTTTTAEGGEGATTTIAPTTTVPAPAECQDAWVWAVIGVSTDSLPQSFITVTWSDGTVTQVTLTGTIGGIAFYTSVQHQDDGIHPVSADYNWPAGSDNWFRALILVQIPCDEGGVPVTTLPPTTTTVMETTTTEAPTTTTAMETTTTAEGGEGATTTTMAPTTTTAPAACDDAWVWAVIGIDTGSLPESFITVTWSDGSVTQVTLTGTIGGIAFYTSVQHQDDGVHPVSADYNWPAGSDDWFRALLLVQIPCDEGGVPVTTMPATTMPDTTMPDTTDVGAGGGEPTTTMATTTSVDVGSGGPTTTLTGAGGGFVGDNGGTSGGSGLPSTGNNVGLLVLLGLGLFVTGSAVWLAGRHHREA